LLVPLDRIHDARSAPYSALDAPGRAEMSNWVPGTPVLTDKHRADWQAWRADRKRQQRTSVAASSNT